MSDFIGREVIPAAVKRYGGEDCIFNAANFGLALMEKIGLRGSLDGLIVKAILEGRPDVVMMGGSYYRQVPSTKESDSTHASDFWAKLLDEE